MHFISNNKIFKNVSQGLSGLMVNALSCEMGGHRGSSLIHVFSLWCPERLGIGLLLGSDIEREEALKKSHLPLFRVFRLG